MLVFQYSAAYVALFSILKLRGSFVLHNSKIALCLRHGDFNCKHLIACNHESVWILTSADLIRLYVWTEAAIVMHVDW